MALDPKRTVAELRELQELTGNEDGAQRVAWTDTWVKAQEWMAGKLDGIEMEFDEARNQWWTVPGDSERDARHRRPPRLGAERRLARRRAERRRGLRGAAANRGGGRPPVTVRLVSWADEEGARFGRSLFGSSAAAGSMRDQDELRQLTDADGTSRCRTRSERTGSTSTARPTREPSARERRRLPRAAHRAGAGAREHGPPARGRARDVRRRAPSRHVARPGGARGLDPDGQAPRRARRRREARARAARDRRPRRRRRRLHDGRRRHEARAS